LKTAVYSDFDLTVGLTFASLSLYFNLILLVSFNPNLAVFLLTKVCLRVLCSFVFTTTTFYGVNGMCLKGYMYIYLQFLSS